MQQTERSGRREIPAVGMPSRVAVAAPPGNDLEPVLALLAGAGLEPTEGTRGMRSTRYPVLVDAQVHGGFDRLPEWLTQNPDAHLLLFYNTPAEVVARAMSGGAEPKEAIEQWQRDAEILLSLVRRNRRRMTLLPLERVLAGPASFIELIGERFDIALEAPDKSAPPPEPPDAVFSMMAENAIWQSIQARNLAAELEASALPIAESDDSAVPAVDRVYREFRARIESAQQRADELEEKNESLARELQQARQDAEASGKKLSALEQSLRELEQQKAELEANSEASEKVQDLQEENDLLLQQLHHVQEELESYFLENRDLKRKLEEAQKQQKEFEIHARKSTNMLNDVHASISWKITAPLRFLVSPFMRGDKAAARKQQSES